MTKGQDKETCVFRIWETNGAGGLTTNVMEYHYNGAGRLVLADYPEADLRLNLFQGTGGTYAGIDRFGRTIDQFWDGYGSTADAAQIKHGYDTAGNRTWREDVQAANNGQHHDEYYGYDALHRLTNVQRGNLTGSPYSGIAGTPGREESWALDQLGNWAVYLTKTAGATDLDQTRTHNAANEIAGANSVAGTPNWADPAHDAAGNMTAAAHAASLTSNMTLVYDAWNRLVLADAGSSPLLTLEYDGLHRVIRKGSDGQRHVYYNESWQILEERDQGASYPVAQYVWHPYYIDALRLRRPHAAGQRPGGDVRRRLDHEPPARAGLDARPAGQLGDVQGAGHGHVNRRLSGALALPFRALSGRSPAA